MNIVSLLKIDYLWLQFCLNLALYIGHFSGHIHRGTLLRQHSYAGKCQAVLVLVVGEM